MSKLSALQGQSKVYTIGGIELEIKPLGLEDMYLFDKGDNATPRENIEMTKQVITKTLMKSVPDATDKEINGMAVEYATELMTAINEVNGLNKESKADLIKNAIARRTQSQT
jgi:hypothetical protein